MKTVINAVDEMSKAELIKPVTGDKVSCYACHVGAFPMQQYCGSCGHELLSELIPVTVPTFTQAMKDAKELPPVGSWFIDVELGDNGTEVEAIAHDLPLKRVVYKSATAIEDCEYFGATIDECKVITPPIELIDGEFYGFEYNSESYRGIYSKREDRFIFVDGHVMANYCKSIKLLEVTK